MRRNRWWTTTVLVMALVAAACGSGDGDGDGTAEVGAETTDASAAEATAADGSGDDASSSPGEATSDESDDGDDEGSIATTELTAAEITDLLFPAFDDDSIADQEAQWQDEERQRQSLIAECMAAQGFEYVPVDYGNEMFFGGVDGDLDPSSREWAETYGFGFTTFAFDEAVSVDEDPWVDPNQDYVEGLSDSARDAYYAALYGNPPEFDATLSEEEMNALLEENPDLFAPQGCEGEAWEATSSFAELDSIWMEFGDQMNEIFERAQADPRIAALEQAWAECMAGKGHAFSSTEDLYDELSERSNELWGPPEDFEDPLAGMTEDEIAALTDEQWSEIYQPFEPDPDALAEVQEWEIALAVDNFDCGGTTQFEEAEAVYAEYQQLFIEENLDALRVALSE